MSGTSGDGGESDVCFQYGEHRQGVYSHFAGDGCELICEQLHDSG